MCLAIPGKIIGRIDTEQVKVLIGGIKKTVRIDLLPDAEIGDYILVHAGYAITRINEKEANEVIRAWEEIDS